MDRSYEDALRIIEARRRLARPKRTESAEDMKPESVPSGTPDLRGTPSIVGMSKWLQQIGHSMADINALNIIHIAGTKGKGSTCSFTESFLRSHGHRTGFPRRTGLYTSPHLILPEERIRLDSIPIDRTLFAKYFFEVYDRLPQLREPYDPTKPPVDRGPRNLQLFALLAFHAFIREKVDVAIFETHNGGEYDATNVVSHPVVTAITTLGMDHVDMLGPTIENIAWHKAGIYKTGAVALSTSQEPTAAAVLRHRANDCGEEVTFINDDDRLPQYVGQLQPSVQRKNASLALAVAETWLRRRLSTRGHQLTSEDIHIGVEQWSWPGRFQVIAQTKHTWFLDAAHNEMSVAIAAQWFAEAVQLKQDESARILVFSHINESRDSQALLGRLGTELRRCRAGVDHVVFTTYNGAHHEPGNEPQAMFDAFHEIWRSVHSEAQLWNEYDIASALSRARRLGDESGAGQILITGSQHLVGPALQILGSSV